MTNNLKAERTLTAEASDADWLDEAARYFENRPIGGEDMAFWANVTNAERCRSIARSLRSQSLSTQQPMGEVTNEMQIEALRLLKAHDEREDKVQEILEDLREIVLLMPAASRPEGLMKQAQAAVYAMRGRTRLMDDEAITAALHPNQESGE